MSFHLTKAIIENSNELTDGQFRVLVCIASFKNQKTGRCHPSISLIADRVNMAERSVRRIIKKLQEDGWLIVRGGGRGPRNSNQYEFPAMEKADSGVTQKADSEVRVKSSISLTEDDDMDDSSDLRTEKGTEKNREQIVQIGLRKGKEVRI